ncbi:transposase [Bradyrhizobium yuanmingense]|uniref:Transposase n=1 Tax=Bradyrhizobium yuanmingense TaxID=108015 RepID=A0ABV4GIN4_9BRAD
MATMADTLPDDPGTLKAMLLAERARAARLEQIIKELQRHRFGRRAETLPEDQLLLGLEEVEQVEASSDAATDAANAAERSSRAARRRRNRGALPAHLPRVEMLIDLDDHACPCCQQALHRIGEDVSERLDIVPAQFRVLVVRRPKYACRACETMVQAPAPARLIEGGLPTEATVAQVLVAKYADHLPLYRQAQIYARQGLDLDRSTLADWVGRAAFLLRPVHERLLARLKQSPKLFADETTAPVLDPGRGRTKTGQLWAYARDDRPWGGTDPPAVAYVYAPDRKAERPIVHLAGFAGILQVDGYAGYRVLAERGDVELAFCWSHVRRRFYELAAAGPAPIASEALERIAGLYVIEAEIRGRTADERRAVRQEKSRPIVDEVRTLAARQAWSDQPEDQTRGGHPICAVALGRADALHCRRPHRDRFQRRRARYPPNRAQPQERPVRWLGRRRRTLGRHRLTDRNLQANRRRTPRLSRRRHHPHRQRPPEQPDRRTATLGLSHYPRTLARGLRTSLTVERHGWRL